MLNIHGFVDVDKAGDMDHIKYTSRYGLTHLEVLLIGSCSGTVNYTSYDTWNPLMQVKSLYGFKYYVQTLGLNNKL